MKKYTPARYASQKVGVYQAKLTDRRLPNSRSHVLKKLVGFQKMHSFVVVSSCAQTHRTHLGSWPVFNSHESAPPTLRSGHRSNGCRPPASYDGHGNGALLSRLPKTYVRRNFLSRSACRSTDLQKHLASDASKWFSHLHFQL